MRDNALLNAIYHMVEVYLWYSRGLMIIILLKPFRICMYMYIRGMLEESTVYVCMYVCMYVCTIYICFHISICI